MRAASNGQVVQEIYEAFGKGDVPAILEKLSEDVAWEQWRENHAQTAGTNHLAERRGRDGAAQFFAIVGQMEIHDFKVLDLIAGDRQVAVEVEIDASLPGGGRFHDEELHLWTFGDDGLVTRMRHYTDTAKHMAAAGVKTAA